MPDLPIIFPSAPPVDVVDLDLSKYTAPKSGTNPLSVQAQPLPKTLPGGAIDASKYQPLPESAANSDINKVRGYNSFNTNPQYNTSEAPIDNIRNYAATQGTGEWLANNFAKFGSVTASAFTGTFNQNIRNIQALTSWDANKLYDNTDGTKAQENLDYKYPTFGTGELDNSAKRFLPWNFGKSDFGGQMLPQLGFTVGTIGETLAENALITLATGGLGEPAELAKSALTSGGKIVSGLQKLFEVSNGITNFRKGLQVLSSIDKENSLGINLMKGAKALANGYAMYNTAAGEAAFEANNIYTQHLQELSDDFEQKNGYKPFGDDLKKMKDSAANTAKTTFGWNIPILLGSNLIQFGNILKPFKSEVAQTVEDVAFNVAGRGLTSTIERQAEREVTSKLGKIFNYAGKAGEFLKEANSEGLEELFQSFASQGSSQYYKSTYNGAKEGTALNDVLNNIFDYAGSTASYNDYFGGFLGGALFAGVGKVSDITGLRDTKFGEKYLGPSEKTQETRKEAIRQQTAEVLSSIKTEDLQKYLFSPEIRNLVQQSVSQDKLSKAVTKGDVLAFDDAKSDSVRDAIMKGIETGKLDTVLSLFDVHKELDNEDIAKLSGLTDVKDISEAKSNVTNLVAAIKQRAYDLQTDWGNLNLKYKNTYQAETNEYNAFNTALRERLFTQDAVREDRKQSRKYRDQVSKDTNGLIHSNLIDHAVDENLLNDRIKLLATVAKNSTDTSTPEYKRQQEELPLLQELRAVKANQTQDFTKQADLLYKIGRLHAQGSALATDIIVNNNDGAKKTISDILKVEDRNFQNIAFYNLLNKKPISESFRQHLQAQQRVAQDIRDNAKLAPTQTTTNPPAEASPYGIIASDYLLTGGIGTLGSTDYLLQALSGTFSKAGSLIEDIRNKYAKEIADSGLTDIKNFVGTDLYNGIVSELRDAINKSYTDKTEANSILDSILKFPTGLPTKLGNELSQRLDNLDSATSQQNQELSEETPDPEQARQEEQDFNNSRKGGSKKQYNLVRYTDTAPPTEVLADPTTNILPLDKQWHRRKDQFLEDLSEGKLPVERKSVKTLIITPNNYSTYSKTLGPLVTLRDGKDGGVDSSPIMMLFVTQEGNDFIPLTKEGKKLPKLDGSSEYKIEDLVYSYHTASADRNYSVDSVMYPTSSSGTEQQQAQEAHRALRKTWLDNTTRPMLYNFTISEGLPNIVKGKSVTNTVQDTGLLKNISSDSVFIPKVTDKFFKTTTPEGNERYLYTNRPYLKIKVGNNFEYHFLENSKLTQKQFESVQHTLESVVDDFFSKGEVIPFSDDRLSYLQSILFLQEKNAYQSPASIVLSQDKKSNTFTISYDFTDKKNPQTLTLSKDTAGSILSDTNFTQWLANRYTNIKVPKEGEFVEYQWDGKSLKEKTWKSYSHYLLSNTDDKGTTRSKEEIPLKLQYYTPQQLSTYFEQPTANEPITTTKQEREQLIKEGAATLPNEYPIVRKQRYVTLEGAPKRDEKGQPKREKAVPQKGITQQAPPQQAPKRETAPNTIPAEHIFSILSQPQYAKLFTATGSAFSWDLAKTKSWIGRDNSDATYAEWLETNVNDISSKGKNDKAGTPGWNVKISALPTWGVGGSNIYLKFLAEAKNFTPLKQEVNTAIEQAPVMSMEPIQVVILPLTKDSVNDTPVLSSQATDNKVVYIPRSIQEAAYKNDKINQTRTGGPQTLDRIIERGGYGVPDLDKLLPNWRQLVKEAQQAISLPTISEKLASPVFETTEEMPTFPEGTVFAVAGDKDDIFGDADDSEVFDAGTKGTKLLTEGDMAAYTPENISQIKVWFKANLPQVDLNIVDRIIKLNSGKLAWGTFNGSVVNVFKNAISGTGYHEAFELVLTSILSPKEQSQLIGQFKNRTGSFLNFATNGETKYSEATDQQAIEELAEEFGRYKTTGKVYEAHRTIFQKVLDFIRRWLLRLPDIQSVFSKLDKGYYANKQLRTLQSGNRIADITPFQQHLLNQGLTFQMVANLSEKTGGFTDLSDSFEEGRMYDELKTFAQNFFVSKDLKQDTLFAAMYQKYNLSDKTGDYKDRANAATNEWKGRQSTWTTINNNWEQFVNDHKVFLKQNAIIFLKDVDDSDTSQDDKNSNDYTKNYFQIDYKNTAPAAIQILFNTLSKSIFDFRTQATIDGKVLLSPRNEVNDVIAMPTLYGNGRELMNITLSKLAELNNLDQMKERFEDILGINEMADKEISEQTRILKEKQSQLNDDPAIYTHLYKVYSRLFSTPISEMTEDNRNLLLKFLSTFSKQKPFFGFLNITSNGDVYVMDSTREHGRQKLISSFFGGMRKYIGDRANRGKTLLSKNRAFYNLNANYLKTALDTNDTNQFILGTAQQLGMQQITPDFLSFITPNQKAQLYSDMRSILTNGLATVSSGAGSKGRVVTKLDARSLDSVSYLNNIADLIMTVQGDKYNPMHRNIEGQDQQDAILNNTISNIMHEMNNATTKQEFLSNHPEFDDPYLTNSLMFKRMWDDEGNRTTFKPKISVIEGINDISIQNGVKSSNLDQKSRLFMDFNANLQSMYNILIPADSETEWYITIPNNHFQYTSNALSNRFVNRVVDYLRDEIESVLDFDNNPLKQADENLNTIRPLRNGTMRMVGKSLQMFKDILSDETVAGIHEAIDNSIPIEDILSEFETDIQRDIRTEIERRSSDTFRYLIKDGIVARSDKKPNEYDEAILPDSEYKFFGLNSNFTKGKNEFYKKEFAMSEDRKYTTDTMSSATLKNLIDYREISYFVNQMEMTKLFTGNPYFYKDLEKRAKSMLSPKENSQYSKQNDTYSFDQQLTIDKNVVTNGTDKVILPSDHIQFHTFKSHIPTWVFRDHITFNPNLGADYESNNSTDAQSFATPPAYRELLIKNGARFTQQQEKQFQLEQAFERYLMDKDGVYRYQDKELQSVDQKIIEGKHKGDQLSYRFDGGVMPILKPLGSGFLEEKGQNPFIYKTSTAMMNYRMVRGTPMQNVYINMLKQRIGNLTYESAFKVGLKRNGNSVPRILSMDDFSGDTTTDITAFNHKIPFKYIGIQVETGTQKDKNTIGTQTTKLLLTDLFEYGVPIDYPTDGKSWEDRLTEWHSLSEEEKNKSDIYRLEKRHRYAIQNLQSQGYYGLLRKLGIQEVNEDGNLSYEYPNGYETTYQLLKNEMSKRGISPNTYELLDDDTLAQKPLEALQNYDQASYIIMSMVNKSIVRPKMNGGQKIQFSSALLNNLKTEGLELYYRSDTDGKMTKLSTQEDYSTLSDKEKDSLLPTSPQLQFYKKGEDEETLSMEVLLPNSFRDKMKKKLPNLTDEELLSWLQENQPNLLKGVGFRIPTQALSSIDSFIIKGFLPSYMGDSVAVPSELTTKVGSDFDVDKLNTYLNNFSINSKGYPEYVRAFGTIEEARSHFAQEFDDKTTKRSSALNYKTRLLDALDAYVRYNELDGELGIEDITSQRVANFIRKNESSIIEELDKFDTDEEAIDSLYENINQMDTGIPKGELLATIRDTYIEKMVKKSLENQYFQIIEDVLKLPQNFSKLLATNNNVGVQEYASDIQDRLNPDRPKTPKGYLNYASLTDSNYLRYKRWAFVVGKSGVGIAALSAINHVNSQKIGFQLNLKGNTSEWFRNSGFIGFKHNNLQGSPLLSGITKADDTTNIAEFVSKYINGYVDIAKGPWILDIGAQLEIASIYLLMERLGISTEDTVYFLNQPVVKHYVSIRAQRNSPISKLNPEYNAMLSRMRNDDDYYQYIKLLTKAESTKSTSFPLNEMKMNIDNWGQSQQLSQYLENVSQEERQKQFDVLTQFLQLKDYADYMRTAQSVSNYDTANVNSLHIMDTKEDNYANIGKSPTLISHIGTGLPMGYALRNDTFVSNIIDKYNSLDKNLISDVFQLQAEPIRRRLREAMMNLQPTLRFDEDGRKTMMDKISKFTVNALALDQTNLIPEIGESMKTANLQSSLDTFREAASRVTISGQDMAMISSNRWIKGLRVQPINSFSDWGYLAIDNAPKNNDGEAEMWRYDLEVLKQSPTFAPLHQMIMRNALLQFGAEYNTNSFANILDWKDFYSQLQEGIDSVENLGNYNLERMIAQSKAFDSSIVYNSPYFTKGTAYRLYQQGNKLVGGVSKKTSLRSNSGNNRWITNNQKTGNISDLIMLRTSNTNPKASAYINKYGFKYFTLKQPLSLLTEKEIKDMASSGNFDYYTSILYENTPFTVTQGGEEYTLFRPLNTHGDRYINEYSNNNQPSLITDRNDVVESSLSDNGVIEALLKSGNFQYSNSEDPQADNSITTEEPFQEPQQVINTPESTVDSSVLSLQTENKKQFQRNAGNLLLSLADETEDTSSDRTISENTTLLQGNTEPLQDNSHNFELDKVKNYLSRKPYGNLSGNGKDDKSYSFTQGDYSDNLQLAESNLRSLWDKRGTNDRDLVLGMFYYISNLANNKYGAIGRQLVTDGYLSSTSGIVKFQNFHNQTDVLMSANDKSITIPIYKFTKKVVENVPSFDNAKVYIQQVLLEEFIHLVQAHITTPEEHEQIYKELSSKEKDRIHYIYNQKTSPLSKEELVDEYVRMVIQNKLTGKTSEDFIDNPKNPVVQLIRKLFRYILKAFGGKSSDSATYQNVEKIMNFITKNESITAPEGLPSIRQDNITEGSCE